MDEKQIDADIPVRPPVASNSRVGVMRSPLVSRLKFAAAVTLGLCNGACALSFPIASFTNDDQATGSIDKTAAVFGPDLDSEDWRRAQAALAVAMDPQGSGADVSWSNPRSGAKGSFVALAPPFPDKDRICRSFDARVSSRTHAGRRLAGSACRSVDGLWTVRDVKATPAV